MAVREVQEGKEGENYYTQREQVRDGFKVVLPVTETTHRMRLHGGRIPGKKKKMENDDDTEEEVGFKVRIDTLGIEMSR